MQPMSVLNWCRFAVPGVAFALSVSLVVAHTLSMSSRVNGAEQRSPEPRPALVSGIARVVDGDTLDLAGRRVRLEGIDAPETGQKCPGRYVGGLLGSWRCGQAATAALARLVDGRRVSCESHEIDRYDRLIATCFVGGLDINAEMVRTGHAWAFVKYSRTYTGEEAARRSKIGIWASRQPPQPAWQYRTRRWASAEQAAPEGCAIKGNISRRGGRIYHTPWSPWYAKVRIDASKGERWFCDEAQALEAGWRAARMR
jgi:endonuclease YncB( thermonuclease family)